MKNVNNFVQFLNELASTEGMDFFGSPEASGAPISIRNKASINSRMLEVEMGMVPVDVTSKSNWGGALPAGVREDIKLLLSKVKKEMLNSPILDQMINKSVSRMSQGEKTAILKMFGADKGQLPSFEDVYAVVSQKALKENLNPGPEEEEDDEFLGFDPADSEEEADEEGLEGPYVPSKLEGPYVPSNPDDPSWATILIKLVKNVAGINLKMIGIPIPLFVNFVLSTPASNELIRAGMLGPLFFYTFIGSLILYTICSVLLGRESS